MEIATKHFCTHPRAQIDMVLPVTHFRHFATHRKIGMASRTIACRIVAGNPREVRSNCRLVFIPTRSACSTSPSREAAAHPYAGMREAATEQEVWKSSSTSTREHATAIANTSTTNSPKEACSPRCKTLLSRPHRPTNLKLNKSNGLTTFTASELKRAICDGHAAFNACATKTQVSQPKSNKRIPKTEDPVAVSMGNNQSGISEPADGADDASIGSVVRKPMRVLRKSSTYLFKRNDSKSPLPRPLTATSILVNQEMSSATDEENTIDPFNDPAHSARDSIIMLPSTSTMTIIDGAEEALGPSITVKESKSDQIPDQAPVEESSCDLEDPPIIAERRSAALSPTIPAPSPLPEDSPHKYGLKDRMDTPEPLQEPPEDINVVKARRRNSGLEIFNVRWTPQITCLRIIIDRVHRKRSLCNRHPRSSTGFPLLAVVQNP